MWLWLMCLEGCDLDVSVLIRAELQVRVLLMLIKVKTGSRVILVDSAF